MFLEGFEGAWVAAHDPHDWTRSEGCQIRNVICATGSAGNAVNARWQSACVVSGEGPAMTVHHKQREGRRWRGKPSCRACQSKLSSFFRSRLLPQTPTSSWGVWISKRAG